MKHERKDAVPGPVLVDRPLIGIQANYWDQLFIHEAIVLLEDPMLCVERQIDLIGPFPPLQAFLTAPVQAGRKGLGSLGILLPATIETICRITHTPSSDVVGVPVVVDVVLVFIGAGHSVHNEGLLALAVMESLKPKTRDAREYFESALEQIGRVQCVADVIVDRKGNGSISVDLLECDLPFVVAFLPVHGDHGVQSGALFETELPGILYGLAQLIIAVDQQVLRHLLRRSGQIERQTIGLCVPIGAASVFLPCEPLGPDIEPLVFSCIGLMELKNV